MRIRRKGKWRPDPCVSTESVGIVVKLDLPPLLHYKSGGDSQQGAHERWRWNIMTIYVTLLPKKAEVSTKKRKSMV